MRLSTYFNKILRQITLLTNHNSQVILANELCFTQFRDGNRSRDASERMRGAILYKYRVKTCTRIVHAQSRERKREGVLRQFYFVTLKFKRVNNLVLSFV